MHLFIFIIILSLYNLASYAADNLNVEAAGTTKTNVTNDNGHFNVVIAPKNNNGTSLNQFKQFDVPKAGVSLDNTNVAATTIINEVIAPNPSRIYGNLEVLGNKAHVIIANPYGIEVNGGYFKNISGLMLTTAGKIEPNFTSGISFINDNNIDYIELKTSQGKITIGEQGLAGLFNNLEILAQEVKINGPIKSEIADAQTKITAGASQTSVKTNQDTNIVNSRFAESVTDNGIKETEIAVDISNLGSISSGKISIIVTDKGAGVRSSGNLKSTSGEIYLSAQNDIEITSANIDSKTSVTMNTENNLKIKDSQIKGQGLMGFNAKNGNVIVQNDKKTTSITGSDVVINAKNGYIANVNSELSADNDIELVSKYDILSLEQEGKKDTLNYYGGNKIKFTSQEGNISFVSANVIANAGLSLNAAKGNVNIILPADPNTNIPQINNYSKKGDKKFFRTTKITGYHVKYGQLLADLDENLFISVGDIDINAKNFLATGLNIYSLGGDLNLKIGDLNDPASGNIAIAAIATGEAQFETQCAWFCRYKGFSDVNIYGGTISVAGDINIEGKNYISEGVNLDVGKNINMVGVGGNTKMQLVLAKSLSAYNFANLYRGLYGNYGHMMNYDFGGSFYARNGKINILSLNPVIINGGEIIAQDGVGAEKGVIILRSNKKSTNLTGRDLGFMSGIL